MSDFLLSAGNSKWFACKIRTNNRQSSHCLLLLLSLLLLLFIVFYNNSSDEIITVMHFPISLGKFFFLLVSCRQIGSFVFLVILLIITLRPDRLAFFSVENFDFLTFKGLQQPILVFDF